MSSIVAVFKEMHGDSTLAKDADSQIHSDGVVGINFKNGSSQKDEIAQKLGCLSLNPNAEEFIPAALRSRNSSVGNSLVNQCNKDNRAGKSLERTVSIKSNGSDDERRRDGRFQLPDDLIPDFDFSSHNILDENASYEESYGAFLDGNAPHERFSSAQTSLSNFPPSGPLKVSAHGFSSGQLLSAEQLLVSQQDGQYSFGEDIGAEYQNEFLNQQAYNGLGDMQLNLLAAEFPNFAVESLAEILYANQGDVMLTMEMLTQLEIQEGASQQQISATPVAPSLSAVDFPALSGFELGNSVTHTVDTDTQPNGRQGLAELSNFFVHPQRSRMCADDFAAIVRKHAPQNTTAWQYEKNGSSTFSGGSLKSLQKARNGNAASTLVTDSFSRTSFRDLEPLEAQPWLETGDAVGGIYSDMREEARDHARVRNAYFQQATQAYLVGNKALAKELSAKGQYHNEQMKAAHSKAGEAIFRQRNEVRNFSHSSRQGQSRLLDLHGLHVNEAILLLKRELAAIKVSARTAPKCQRVFICVGTGHHTKGSRTPARLPAAVERYLLEDERLQFTETEPGMLLVVL